MLFPLLYQFFKLRPAAAAEVLLTAVVWQRHVAQGGKFFVGALGLDAGEGVVRLTPSRAISRRTRASFGAVTATVTSQSVSRPLSKRPMASMTARPGGGQPPFDLPPDGGLGQRRQAAEGPFVGKDLGAQLLPLEDAPLHGAGEGPLDLAPKGLCRFSAAHGRFRRRQNRRRPSPAAPRGPWSCRSRNLPSVRLPWLIPPQSGIRRPCSAGS